jgi:hypothetical protein
MERHRRAASVKIRSVPASGTPPHFALPESFRGAQMLELKRISWMRRLLRLAMAALAVWIFAAAILSLVARSGNAPVGGRPNRSGCWTASRTPPSVGTSWASRCSSRRRTGTRRRRSTTSPWTGGTAAPPHHPGLGGRERAERVRPSARRPPSPSRMACRG